MTGRRWGAKVSKMVLLCLKCFFLPHPVAQKRAAHLSGMDLCSCQLHYLPATTLEDSGDIVTIPHIWIGMSK